MHHIDPIPPYRSEGISSRREVDELPANRGHHERTTLVRTIIKDRQELDSHLLEAQTKMKQLIQKAGPDPVLLAVLRQLEAIASWTANGRNMTQQEKDRIVMGLQADREMADFPVEHDLVCALHSYIESRMPTAPHPQ
jgi:hypothetical protein